MPQFEIINDASMQVVVEGTNTKPIITGTTIHNFGSNLMYEPIPFEMLQTYTTKPQISMKVGSLPASCPNLDCDYEYVDQVEDISSFTFT